MNRDVTVFVLADRSTMLSLNTRSLVSFLYEARLIDDSNVQLAEEIAPHDLCDLITHSGVIPFITSQKFLQGSGSNPRI